MLRYRNEVFMYPKKMIEQGRPILLQHDLDARDPDDPRCDAMEHAKATLQALGIYRCHIA